MDQILTPFSKLPQLNTATILIVGAQGVGKHDLAKALVDVKSQFCLQIRTATSLPLPAENANERPRIDYVVFLIDISNGLSLPTVEKSLPKLDISYFLGRACFVVTESQKSVESSVNIETVMPLADAYDSPILCVNLEDPMDRESLANKILTMTEIAVGFKHNISPLLLETTKTPSYVKKL